MPLKNLNELKKKLRQAAAEKRQAKRSVRIAAVIAEALRQIDQDPVLVGGAAVEFYTEGGYSTQDIDMVAPGGRELWGVMKQLGFERLGKDFIHEQLKIYVEFPGETLKEGEVSDLLDVDGIALNIISPEDLIVDRLRAYKFWRSVIDGVNALLLLEVGPADSEKLRTQARRYDVDDALQAVQEIYQEVFRKRLSKKQATRKLQEWVRRGSSF